MRRVAEPSSAATPQHMNMNKIDTFCRRLRDVGVFLIGVAAVASCAYFIYDRAHSPQRKMERAMQRAFTQGFEQALADGKRK
jgi:hypothetical protein